MANALQYLVQTFGAPRLISEDETPATSGSEDNSKKEPVVEVPKETQKETPTNAQKDDSNVETHDAQPTSDKPDPTKEVKTDGEPKKASGSKLKTEKEIKGAIDDAKERLKKAEDIKPATDKSKTAIEYWEDALENHEQELKSIKNGDIVDSGEDKDVHDKHDSVDIAEKEKLDADVALAGDPENEDLKAASKAAHEKLDKAESEKEKSMEVAKEARRKRKETAQAELDKANSTDVAQNGDMRKDVRTPADVPGRVSNPPAIMTGDGKVHDLAIQATDDAANKQIELEKEQEVLNNLAGKTASKMAQHNREGLIKKIAKKSGEFALSLLKGLAGGIQIDDKGMDALVGDNMAAEIFMTSIDGLNEEKKKAVIKGIKGPYRDAIDRLDTQIELKEEEISKEESRIGSSSEKTQKEDEEDEKKVAELGSAADGNEVVKKYEDLLEELKEKLKELDERIKEKSTEEAQENQNQKTQQKQLSGSEQPKQIKSEGFNEFYKNLNLINEAEEYEAPKSEGEIQNLIDNAEQKMNAAKEIGDAPVEEYWSNALEAHKEDLELFKQSKEDGSEFIAYNPGTPPKNEENPDVLKNYKKNRPSKKDIQERRDKCKIDRVKQRMTITKKKEEDTQLLYNNAIKKKKDLIDEVKALKIKEPNSQKLVAKEQELAEHNNSVTDIEKKYDGLKNASEKHSKTHESLTKEPLKEPESSDKDDNDIASIRASFKTNSEVEKKNDELGNAFKEASKTHNENVEKLKKLQQSKEASGISDEDYESAENEYDTSEQAVRDLEYDIRSGVEGAREKLGHAKIAQKSAKNKFENIKRKYIDPNEIEDAQSAIADSQKNVEETKKAFDEHSTTNKIDSSTKALKEKRKVLVEKIKQLDEKIKQLRKPYDDEIASINKKKEEKGSKLKTLQNELKVLQAKRDAAEKTYGKIEKKEAEKDMVESFKFVSDRKSVNFLMEYVKDIKVEK